MTETKKERRTGFTGGDRIVLYMLLALAIAIVVVLVLNGLSMRLVAGELYLFLPLAVVLLLLGWGVSLLWRRMKPGALRKAVGAVLVVAMLILVMLATTYVTLFAGMNIPRKFAVVSNDGHSLLVMRVLDSDEGRIEARHAARLAADPESDQAVTTADWGFTYLAYAPKVMGLFYRPDSLIEGEVHIGYASKAELMVEWEDDVGHFFIKNPETGDDGEMRAKS